MRRRIETLVKLNNIEQKNAVEELNLSQTLFGIIIVEDMLKDIDVGIKSAKEKFKIVVNDLKLRHEQIKDDQIIRGLLDDLNPYIEEFQIKLAEKNRCHWVLTCGIQNMNAYFIKLKREVNSLTIKRSDLSELLALLKYHQYQLINEPQDLIKRINELEKEIRKIKRLQPRLDSKPSPDQYGRLFKRQGSGIFESVEPIQSRAPSPK